MSVSGAGSRGDDYGLRSLDSLGDLDELRVNAERAIADLEVDPRPEASQVGADGSNSVWVTVSPVGAVLDVSISRQWTGRLPAEQLGEAILTAYRQAHEKRGAAALLATMRHGDEGGSENTSEDSYDPGMPDIQDPRWLGWVWHSLDEAGLRADQLFAQRSPETTTGRMVSSPSGYVRLRVTGSQVTAVLLDAVGVAERNPDAVAVDVRAAFETLRTGGR